MTTRAKFKVDALTRTIGHRQGRPAELWNVSLSPVYSPDPTHENATFWAATPGGKIELSCTTPHPHTFPLGGEVYVDFTPCAARPQAEV